MKVVLKMFKVKCQEEQVNFISWCFVLLCGCILLVLVFLLGCVVWLQVISFDMLVCQGDMCFLCVQEVFIVCGMIIDCFGCLLVVSVLVKVIWVDLKEFYDVGGVILDMCWKVLVDVFNMLLDQLVMCININLWMWFIYLVCQVNFDMVDYIKKLKLLGIYLCEEFCWYYFFGEVIVYFIGFINVDSQGIEGVEKSFDKWFIGQLGECIVCKDCYGWVIEDIFFIDSQVVYNLVLSIDECLQVLVYCELNNVVVFNKVELGSVVLVDVNIGEVLVMVNSLFYNLNNFVGMVKDIMCNCVIIDVFELGLMVKLMVVMMVLQCGIVNENIVFNIVFY